MRIVVNDVAASKGGALSILKSFYHYILSHEEYRQIEWVFLLSDLYVEETENIKVVVLKEIKKSWLSRIWYDLFKMKRIISEIEPDIIFSLQNLVMPGIRLPQAVYIHQSIPFQTVKNFSFFKKEETLYAVYQKVIGRMIRSSVRRANLAVVQTQWMQQAVVDKCGAEPDKILNLLPDVRKCKGQVDPNRFDRTQFFYPAFKSLYKNQQCILEACDILLGRGVDKFTVRLTYHDQERKNNVDFCGELSPDEVFKTYQNSTLLFPSYIETLGLPLLEARQVGTLILASDCPFSREVLQGYPNAYFFDPFDPRQLAELMQGVIQGQLPLLPIQNAAFNCECHWNLVIDRLIKIGK